MTLETTELTLSEALTLLHAQLAFLARENGLRCLFIKGPAVFAQGLREPRQSSDVDIWLEQEAINKLAGDLYKLGWKNRPTDPYASPFSSHSLTLYSPNWPCDIDIHSRIPGMEASSQDAFESVWVGRENHIMAGIPLSIPSTEASRLILALHSLRSKESPREPAEYNSLIGQDFKDFKEFQDLALATNSVGALKPFLRDTQSYSLFDYYPEPSTEWLHLSSQKSHAEKRLDAVAKSPVSKLPLALWRATFPSKEALMVHDLYQDTSFIGILKTNIGRYKRGLRAIKEKVTR
ncbi:nucleotidyltransferase family protein [Arthrobacter alpinus]|nr:nucleotidyltransferase family protein [Arthrobacter alpinus]